MAKGKDAELKEARLRVAMSPHNTKLKPWVRAKTYHTPTSSEEDELVVAPKKKDAYYPMTPRRSVKLSRPLTPKAKVNDDAELNELVLPDVKGNVVGVVGEAFNDGEAKADMTGEAKVDYGKSKSRRRKGKRIIKAKTEEE